MSQTITPAAAQLANRAAAFAAIKTAEVHLSLGATSPAALEALADAILAADGHEVPTVTRERLAAEAREAKRLRAERCAIDHAAVVIRPAVAGRRSPGEAVAAAWVAEILSPSRRHPSRGERAAATALARRLAVRVTTVAARDRKSAAAKAVAAHRAREASIAAGAAVVLPTQGWECFAQPTRSHREPQVLGHRARFALEVLAAHEAE